MYAVAKILYSHALFEKAAAEMKAVLRGSLGHTKKVVVCDLDNTLWGGVVGDDGRDNIKLGAPDAVGECFYGFQKALKGLRARGILLTICSKNDEAFALSVIDEHPAMILRKSDFVAWRINWKDKAENLVSLAEELNLGVDSFVFLDDSPQERDQVRQLLPQVFTPDLPTSPSGLAPFVSSLNCFETAGIGKEDYDRADMYWAERGRKEAQDLSGDVDNWLRSLQIEVRATPLRRENLARAAQLLNKTNQFNLSLRASGRNQLLGLGSGALQLRLRFPCLGSLWRLRSNRSCKLYSPRPEARLVDFVMSCRVMGKKVEEALLGYTLARARTPLAQCVMAPTVDGPWNGPARDFFSQKFSNGDAPTIDPARVRVPALRSTLREEN